VEGGGRGEERREARCGESGEGAGRGPQETRMRFIEPTRERTVGEMRRVDVYRSYFRIDPDIADVFSWTTL